MLYRHYHRPERKRLGLQHYINQEFAHSTFEVVVHRQPNGNSMKRWKPAIEIMINREQNLSDYPSFTP
eukprot:9327967-Karenia_brevis.AAC.1